MTGYLFGSMGLLLRRAMAGAVVIMAAAFPTAGAGALAAPAPGVGDPTVSLSTYAGLATEVTYDVSFTTGARGALAADKGTVTLVAPQGTVFPSENPDYTVVDAGTKAASPISGNPAVAAGGSVVSVTVGAPVAAGQRVSLVVAGVANAAPGPQSLAIATSSGIRPVAAPPYRLVPAAGVVAPSLSLSSDAAGAGQVTYTVGFTASAQGGLVANQGTITLVAPEGTVFPAADYSVTDVSTKTTSPVSGNPEVTGGGSVVTVTLVSALAAGQQVSLAVAGVANPPAGRGALTVATSSDTVTASAPLYRLTGATGVVGPSLSLSSDAAGAALVTYTVGFTTSSQGGLVASQSTITLVAPQGTVFPSFAPDYSLTNSGTNTTSSIYGNPSVAGGGRVVTVTLGAAVAAGAQVALVVAGVTNPAPRSQH